MTPAASYYQIAYTRDFMQQLHGLDGKIFAKWQRIGKLLSKDPFDDSVLRIEKVKGAHAGVWSVRLDDNYRILFQHIKPDQVVIFWVDTHDAAYAKAARTSVVLEDGKVKIVDTSTSESRRVGETFAPTTQPRGLFFGRWDDKTLLDCGLPPEWLPGIRQLNTLDEFENAEGQIPDTAFYNLFKLVVDSEPPKQGPTVSDTQLLLALSKPETREDIYVFEHSQEFEKALAGSLTEWMLFLHPSQKQVVESNFSGPARIKGGAGTGKTVVALHRARYLTNSLTNSALSKVLVLSFNNRLAVVVKESLRRLCSAEEFSHIEVKTLHQWCAWYLRYQCNENLDKADDRRISGLLDIAIQHARRDYPESKIFTQPPDFIEDEIRYVIKGRAISTLEQYLQLKRTGRGTPLGAEERRAIFAIYSRYQSGLGKQCDWDDFILKALRYIEQGVALGPYAAVIVDEAQDFTEAAMRLIGRIGGPEPNRLLLIGDGQQKIYKGGFVLKDVGISIVGRSRILRENYRNTREILEAAYSMIRNGSVEDLEDDDESAPASPVFPKRSGPKPIIKTFVTKEAELTWVADQIKQLVTVQHTYVAGDIGILYVSGRQYGAQIDAVMRAQGLPVVELQRSRESEFFDQNSVKRCTFHSAKGMEFKVVFLVGVADGTIPSNPNVANEILEETLGRERRLLFVAMTRARDKLYMSSAGTQPSRFLGDIEPGLIEIG